MAYATLITQDKNCHHRRSTGQGMEIDCVRVKARDDQNYTQVIGNRERGQKDDQVPRDTPCQQHQYRDREGDVRGHWDPPASRGIGALIETVIHQGWNEHTAQGSRHRERRALQRRQLTDQDLSLELQSHAQKEQGHEGLVDPMLEAQLELQRADADTAGLLPEPGKGPASGRVRQDKRNYGRHHQDGATRGRALKKTLKRDENATEQRL